MLMAGSSSPPLNQTTGLPLTGPGSSTIRRVSGGVQTGGMSKLYKGALALEGVGTLFSGFSSFMANRSESRLLERQAELALQESRVEAERHARNVRRFQATQSTRFAKSGVTLEGSPVLVLEETRRLGQQEVDAIMRQGEAQSSLIREQAGQRKRTGRNSFISSFVKTGASALNSFILGQRIGIFGNTGGSPLVNNGPAPVPANP